MQLRFSQGLHSDSLSSSRCLHLFTPPNAFQRSIPTDLLIRMGFEEARREEYATDILPDSSSPKVADL